MKKRIFWFVFIEIILLIAVWYGYELTTQSIVIKSMGTHPGSCIGTPCFADVFPYPNSVLLGIKIMKVSLLLAGAYAFITVLLVVFKKRQKIIISNPTENS